MKTNISPKGISLSYVAPIVKDGRHVTMVDYQEVKEMGQLWEHSLIRYVMGYTPITESIRRFIACGWNHVVSPTIYLQDEGFFFCNLKVKWTVR